MASDKQIRSSKTPVKFSLEDFDALLNFPFHDYAADIKKEVIQESEGYILPDTPSLDNSTNQSLSHQEPKSEPINNDATSSQEECLLLNQALQNHIQQILVRLDAALQKNISKQNELLESIKDSEKSLAEDKIRHTKPISLFAAPYFRDVRGMVPPDNEDTLEKFRRIDVTAYLQPPKPWTRTEKDRLIEGVAASALNAVLKPYKTKRDYLKSKLKDKNWLEFEIEVLKKQIIKIEKKIKIESERPLPDLLEEAKDKLDWMTISATNLQGTKSEEECEIMWINYLSNTVNKAPFTFEEDQKLKLLVQLKKKRDWETIASRLKTGRTPIQCLERYQTQLNESLTKKYWTPEEDSRLLQLVDSLKIGDYIPWNKVCCYMEGWKRHQILNRYDRTVSKEIKRGPFSKEEDAMLLACSKKFGLRWTKMKELLPGRPSYSIRERYVNTLDPTLKIGSWTKKEDIQLIKLIKKYGFGKWAKIAREMVGRTDNMCLVRAQTLEQHTKKKTRSGKKQVLDKNGKLVLLPAAPSKTCFAQNARLKSIHNSALSTLVSAFKAIEPFIKDKIDYETLNLSEVSMDTMKKLQKELYSRMSDNDLSEKESDDEWTPHYVPPQFQKAKFNPKKLYMHDLDDFASTDSDEVKKNNANEEESESDLEIEDEEKDEEFLTLEEKLWLKENLSHRLEEEARLRPSNMKPSIISLNSREAAECAFYRSYLRQKLFCNEIKKEEEEEIGQTKLEYENDLSDVIKYFMQPNTDDNQPTVLCPNFATTSAMEIMEMTKPRLRRTAGFIDQSESYLQYLFGQKETKPKCTKCKGISPNSTPAACETLLRSMHNKFLIVDDSFQTAAKVELGFPSEECCCDELSKSREAFNLLQKRFLSLFLWPSLLSTTDLTPEQASLINKNVANKYTISKAKPISFPGLKRKKNINKPKPYKREKPYRRGKPSEESTQAGPRRSGRKSVLQKKSPSS